MPHTTSKARRVFHDFDRVSTTPDARLARSFEHTDPEIAIVAVEPFDDGPTIPRWFLPGLGFLVAGVLISHFWRKRKQDQAGELTRRPSAVPSAVPSQVGCGFDLLGAE